MPVFQMEWGQDFRPVPQSELVLDLLEQFLEAGFSKETAIRMINSSLVLQRMPGFFPRWIWRR